MWVGPQIDHAWVELQRTAGGRSRALYAALAAWLDRQQYHQARRKPGWALFFQFLAGTTATFIFYLLGSCLWLALHWLQAPWPLLRAAGVALGLSSLWLAYPRLLAAPPAAVQIDADSFPVLHHLVTALAILTQTPTPSIVLTEQFGVAFGRIGWRRRPVLLLGHPLLLVLEPHEIVTVITHELTHNRDGAATRSLYLLLALNIAAQWQRRLAPYPPPAPVEQDGRQYWRTRAISSLSWVWRPAYWLTAGLYAALRFCMARDAQQAEYHVDELTTAVAGTVDMARLMQKFLYGYAPQVWSSYARAQPACKPTALACAVQRIPQASLARLWDEALRQPRSLTEWHPPLTYRLAVLGQRAPVRPKLQLSPAQIQALHRELQLWPVVISRRAVDWQHAATPPQPETMPDSEMGRRAKVMGTG